jgi:pimeloyl-ACP methyl ester carboxylesterase
MIHMSGRMIVASCTPFASRRFPSAARWTLLALLTLALLPAHSEERWRTLPATPSLPPGTAGQRAMINGAQLWYAEWGSHNKGVPVLLLHGGSLNSNYFGQLVPTLVKHGYLVIAMDSRGQGRSTRGDGSITFHMMAADVLELLDRLLIRQVSLVGWSDGGIIGLDLAIHHPERLHRLFAFGANADLSGIDEHAEAAPLVAAFEARAKVEYRQLSPTPDDWESFKATMEQMWNTLPAFTREQLGSIRVPTTIADGQHDEIIKPEHTLYLAAAIPNAKLVILPDVSHFAILQDPPAFSAAVLDFLRD